MALARVCTNVQRESPPAPVQPLGLEEKAARTGDGEEEAEAREVGENEDNSDVEAVQRLLALSSIHERKKERNLADLARLSFWVACLLTGDRGSRVATNILLSALGVPTRLHFPEADPDPTTRYHEIKVWLTLSRGNFSASIYNIHIALSGAAMDTDNLEASNRAHSHLNEFLEEAEKHFRPGFLAMWRAAMPLLRSPRKFAILTALRRLLENEAEWYDQQNSA
jgi:hypothetical protein